MLTLLQMSLSPPSFAHLQLAQPPLHSGHHHTVIWAVSYAYMFFLLFKPLSLVLCFDRLVN